ncbi:hypothetical protein FNV43_RR13231 [Rhamnella rubrinervis]|uniref:Transducin/WD40 repeat-like superfamily protein n=1 Tax=Rhamnella rubrinervis TaxID=2594499 RepID=A0A8K0H0S4_9ROSA|nr:hypothetical protein FNV43_RR13231 [Rhamnella rubrinervis]
MEVVVASSSVDAGIGCWNLQTGAELLRYKTCASPPHGLVCVGQRFIASSQLRDSSASSGSVLYWSWSKPQVEVKSFPAEQIKPLAANHEGTYIVGGGSSGIFDDYTRNQASSPYVHSFSEHTLSVTDVVVGYGGGNAIIVSASEDRTCKVRKEGLEHVEGKILKLLCSFNNDAVALDPGEHVFYAGSRDGKIYVAALNAESTYNNKYGLHIINSFSTHSKAVTSLAYGTTGNLLISGSEDGMVRVWDARTLNVVSIFKHAKGPVNNIIVVRQQLYPNFQINPNMSTSSKRHGSLLPPPLEKYMTSTDEVTDFKTVIGLQATCSESMDLVYLSSRVMNNQIKNFRPSLIKPCLASFQQQGSAASEIEAEKLKLDCKRSMQMAQQWKKCMKTCINSV